MSTGPLFLQLKKWEIISARDRAETDAMHRARSNPAPPPRCIASLKAMTEANDDLLAWAAQKRGEVKLSESPTG